MKKGIVYIFLLLFYSCNEYNSRIIIRTIDIGNGNTIEVYQYSYISSISPYNVDLKNKNSHRPIFMHPNISDIRFERDTLFIKADRSYQTWFYDSSLIKMKIDTSEICFIQDRLLPIKSE